jgi:hypothetical protein
MNGVLFNWSAALGAWAIGGPFWAALTFLAIALVRVSIDAQALRRDNLELKRRLMEHHGDVFGTDVGPEIEPPVESEIRPSRTAVPAVRAV